MSTQVQAQPAANVTNRAQPRFVSPTCAMPGASCKWLPAHAWLPRCQVAAARAAAEEEAEAEDAAAAEAAEAAAAGDVSAEGTVEDGERGLEAAVDEVWSSSLVFFLRAAPIQHLEHF